MYVVLKPHFMTTSSYLAVLVLTTILFLNKHLTILKEKKIPYIQEIDRYIQLLHKTKIFKKYMTASFDAGGQKFVVHNCCIANFLYILGIEMRHYTKGERFVLFLSA
jgi:hypothetical protein